MHPKKVGNSVFFFVNCLIALHKTWKKCLTMSSPTWRPPASTAGCSFDKDYYCTSCEIAKWSSFSHLKGISKLELENHSPPSISHKKKNLKRSPNFSGLTENVNVPLHPSFFWKLSRNVYALHTRCFFFFCTLAADLCAQSGASWQKFLHRRAQEEVY